MNPDSLATDVITLLSVALHWSATSSLTIMIIAILTCNIPVGNIAAAAPCNGCARPLVVDIFAVVDLGLVVQCTWHP